MAGLSVLELYHRHGIILRDLKPENTMIDLSTDGLTVKFVDFGTAGPKGYASTAGEWRGTPSCFPPAYFRWELDQYSVAKPPQDEQSDRYALGLILLTLATRKLPFADTHHRKLLPRQVIDQAWRRDLEQSRIVDESFKDQVLGLLDPPTSH